jgi:AmmeMemoRadiSam system protein B
MNLRKSQLPPGWYPRSEREIQKFFGYGHQKSRTARAFAAIAPHAGWYYSGKIAAKAVSSLVPLETRDVVDTVIILGGHLPGGHPVLYAEEDGVISPLGNMVIDREFRDSLIKKTGGRSDRYHDNTVEVLIPMVHYFFPGSALVWLRFPAEKASYELGKEIAALGLELGRSLAVLGSTDLTHYGANYGFSPAGAGLKALDWVEKVNDASFIDALKAGDPETVLKRADEDKSACSAGAVLGVMGYADARGFPHAELLEYGTSAGADLEPGEELSEQEIPDSFVGYGAFGWF